MDNDADEPTPLVIMIAMPTRGQVELATVASLIGLTQEFQRHGLAFSFDTYTGAADLAVNRNHLMSKFYSNRSFSHMLMIDSDMMFSPDAVWRLIAFGGDFVSSAYPQKYYNWEQLRKLIEADFQRPEEERTPIEELVSRSMTYNHQLRSFGNGDWQPETRNGFISVPAAGQGLTLLSRKVPKTMIERGLVQKYPDMSLLPAHRGLEWYDFFGNLTSESRGLYLHEDQRFSNRWVEGCGGTIWLDCETTIRHVGAHTFEGRYSDKVDDDFPHLRDL
ncbi:hypothetical protein [Roseibium aggregatum]|uniref:Uncharacterized protein n=1 Tax=Roseibium aggregatum TaxID=187304 RepID=A0A939J5C6_9HYPH|nr:hypothetical protein [Roseibium aggregatum]MBN9672105.1 hypothetical protein [Roseibium aggregatum]